MIILVLQWATLYLSFEKDLLFSKNQVFFKKIRKPWEASVNHELIFFEILHLNFSLAMPASVRIFFHFSRISRYFEQCKKILASLQNLGNQVFQFLFITTAQHKLQKLLQNFLQALLWERRAKFQRKIINFTRLRALRSSDFHKPKTRFLLNSNSFSNIKYRLWHCRTIIIN